jgi:uncharacterized OB-fold protein
MAEVKSDVEPAVDVPPESAISSWFSAGPQPHLNGLKCTVCGNAVFPPRALTCPNPSCSSNEFETVPLGRRGRLWSFTDSQYAPPPPYVKGEGEYQPFVLVAVELDDDKMIVLGQTVSEVRIEDLQVGMPMELTTGPLGDGALVWKWQPAEEAS